MDFEENEASVGALDWLCSRASTRGYESDVLVEVCLRDAARLCFLVPGIGGKPVSMADTPGSQTGTPPSVALAYAVAALQSASDSDETKDLIKESLEIARSSSKKERAEETSRTEQMDDEDSDDETDKGQDDETDSPDGKDDSAKRLARSRERNREHARRTRLRKKAQLEALQVKVKTLEAERQTLRQQIEECSVASILLGLSSGEQDDQTQDLLEKTAKPDAKANRVAMLAGDKRKRFISDALGEKQSRPLKLNIDDQTTLVVGGKSHINWKTGVYIDETGAPMQLTPDQLENLRRERNRMHAKMTRDRKKNFISTIEKTISELESDINRMKDILAKVAAQKGSQPGTPATSPKLKASTPLLDDEDVSSVYSEAADAETDTKSTPASKRKRHGFAMKKLSL